MKYNEPIMNIISRIDSEISGWTPPDELFALFLLAYSNSHIKGDFIEIGSWCGRSSAVLATAAQLTNVENVVCVDLFPNKNDWYTNPDFTHFFKVIIEKEYFGYDESSVFDEPFVKDILPVYKDNESLYRIFNNNMIKFGVEKIIFPIKGTSGHLKDYFGNEFKCKLAFVDGGHGYHNVCDDIDNIFPYLVPDAWICFDDAFSSYKQVSKAIEDKIINNDDYYCKQQLARKFFVARKR